MKIEIDNLTFRYALAEKNALENINFTVNQGDYIVLCGRSGCGKTTLLRHLKNAFTPEGERSGKVLFDGIDINEIGLREQSEKVGFVLQEPESQIVTDKVWHELSFGLENLGYDSSTIRMRCAEMAEYFGISHLFSKDVKNLSGGEKQILNLASVMVMNPDVLLLDEPVSQLDPVASVNFLNTVKKINRELGVTVIISEHRLEEIFADADKIAVMDSGKIVSFATPENTGAKLGESLDFIRYLMPSPMRIYADVGDFRYKCPVTVRDGRQWLSLLFSDSDNIIQPQKKEYIHNTKALELKNISYRYDKNDGYVLDGLDFFAEEGKFTAILGGNGEGKSTLLKIIAGLYKPNSGKVKCSKKISMLPQYVQTVFTEKTVLEDLLLVSDKEQVENTAKKFGIKEILNKNPFDISGGEMQRAALAKVMLTKPRILLLDEPTKGMDAEFKRVFADIIKNIISDSCTVVAVSHDVEFCAEYADSSAMLFDKKIVAQKPSGEFFSENSYYTTSALRMSRHIFSGAVTAEEVSEICKKNLSK